MIDLDKISFYDNTTACSLDTNLQQLSRRVFKINITSIPEIENEEQKKAKEQLTFNTTYPLFSLIIEQLTIFNTLQKSINVNFLEKTLEKKFHKYLTDTDYNKELSKLRTYVFNRPNTYLFITKDTEGLPVINFAPINRIKFEDDKTLIIEITENIYRVIEFTDFKDGLNWYDYTVEIRKKTDKSGSELIIIDKPTVIPYNKKYVLNHKPFKKVGFETYFANIKDTIIFEAIDLMKIYQRDSDNFEVTKLYHAFPQRSEITLKCNKCGGTGHTLNSDNDEIECPACHGSGTVTIKNTAESIKVPALIPNDQRPYMSEPIVYAKTDINILKFQEDNLKNIEKKIIYFSTGLDNQAINTLKTATEIIENKIPLNKKNNEISKQFAEFEVWILSVMAEIYSPKFLDCTIEYEQLYTGKVAHDILTMIESAKINNLPTAFIQNLYEDLVKAYYNDKEKQQIILNDGKIETTTKTTTEKG